MKIDLKRLVILPRSIASRLAIACAFALLLTHLGAAEPSEGGTIVGRVLNPATGEYVRNAQLSIEGTGQIVTSEEGGAYRLTPIASGEVTVIVSYTGYRPATATVRVNAGETVTRDFELMSSLQTAAQDGTAVKMSEFVVSAEREGNAKAIMEQRNSMNITNSVASDVFGDVAEGNIGEFLKHLPGVDLNYEEGVPRNIRLRGLPTEYTAVTIDGVSLASADALAGGSASGRALSVEQVSLSSMESIEVLKTVSADVDANAPAGIINLKTKRAFDRQGRRITLQSNVTAFSENFNLDQSMGPDERRRRKMLPGGILEYSDVFFNKRLGVVLNISESNVYSVITRSTVTYDRNPTAADPRPAVVTSINLMTGPRMNERFTTTLTTDFKATAHLVLSFGFVYNYADLWYVHHQATFATGARATVVGADPLLSLTTSAANASVNVNPQMIAKLGETFTYLPRFEYKRGDLTVEGKFVATDSRSWYDPKNHRDSLFNFGSPTLSGVTYRAERSSLTSGDWKVTQLAGPDWSNGAGFSSPEVRVDDGRLGKTQLYGGEIAATLKTRQLLPVVWKAGLKTQREIRDFNTEQNALLYNYIGPGSGTGSWAAYQSPYDLDLSMMNATIVASSGRPIFAPNLLEGGRLYRERPGDFAQSLTAVNYYSAFIGNKKHYEEDINAAFLMGTASIGKLLFRAGLRSEDTGTDSFEFDPRTAAEVRAAGYAVASGRATTIPGLQYQYFSKPRVHRTGSYDNLFPSASAKYKFTGNLDLHLGYSRTIRRPAFFNVAGVWTINDSTLNATVPNPNLRPELSDNLSARLAYYFEPVGIVGVNLFQNNVDGLHLSTRMTAQEFGYTGEDLANYTFITTDNSVNKRVIRGMELEYSQSLSFLPRAFKGFNVRASYTRNYSRDITIGMAPHLVTTGLNYSLGRVNAYTRFRWTADAPLNANGSTYWRHRADVDIGGGYRFSNNLSFFFTAANLFDTPLTQMTRIDPVPPVATQYQIIGTTWTFGVKGVF